MIDALIRLYFNILFLITCLSAIEYLFVIEKLSFIGITFFGFAQNTIYDFKMLYWTHGGSVFDKCHKNYSIDQASTMLKTFHTPLVNYLVPFFPHFLHIFFLFHTHLKEWRFILRTDWNLP